MFSIPPLWKNVSKEKIISFLKKEKINVSILVLLTLFYLNPLHLGSEVGYFFNVFLFHSNSGVKTILFLLFLLFSFNIPRFLKVEKNRWLTLTIIVLTVLLLFGQYHNKTLYFRITDDLGLKDSCTAFTIWGENPERVLESYIKIRHSHPLKGFLSFFPFFDQALARPFVSSLDIGLNALILILFPILYIFILTQLREKKNIFLIATFFFLMLTGLYDVGFPSIIISFIPLVVFFSYRKIKGRWKIPVSVLICAALFFLALVSNFIFYSINNPLCLDPGSVPNIAKEEILSFSYIDKGIPHLYLFRAVYLIVFSMFIMTEIKRDKYILRSTFLILTVLLFIFYPTYYTGDFIRKSGKYAFLSGHIPKHEKIDIQKIEKLDDNLYWGIFKAKGGMIYRYGSFCRNLEQKGNVFTGCTLDACKDLRIKSVRFFLFSEGGINPGKSVPFLKQEDFKRNGLRLVYTRGIPRCFGGKVFFHKMISYKLENRTGGNVFIIYKNLQLISALSPIT